MRSELAATEPSDGRRTVLQPLARAAAVPLGPNGTLLALLKDFMRAASLVKLCRDPFISHPCPSWTVRRTLKPNKSSSSFSVTRISRFQFCRNFRERCMMDATLRPKFSPRAAAFPQREETKREDGQNMENSERNWNKIYPSFFASPQLLRELMYRVGHC